MSRFSGAFRLWNTTTSKIQAAGPKEHQCGIIGDHDDPVDDTVCGEKETPEKKKVADIEQGASDRNENSRNSMDGEAADRTDAHQDQGSDINSEERHLFSDRLPPSEKESGVMLSMPMTSVFSPKVNVLPSANVYFRCTIMPFLLPKSSMPVDKGRYLP